jgi:predicted site-specific integrase-resolvase
MLKMVKEAFNDHINSLEHRITYPNDYIEWSLSDIYTDIVSNELKEFNEERSFKLLSESEVDYVLDMMQTRYKDFRKTEMIKPFYMKAHMTFK